MFSEHVRKFLLISVVAVGVTGLSSCLHMAETFGLIPKKPEISLADFQVKSVSFSSVDVEVVVGVLNQDQRDLEVGSLTFDLFMSDSKLGSGAAADKIFVKPGTEQKVKFPISLKTKELVGAAIDLMGGKTREKARIRGRAEVKTWAGMLAVPFDRDIGK